MPQGLCALCDWLCAEGVTGVVMEATGIYWEKPHDMLREAGLEVSVVNAQQIKQIRGHKTDVSDSVWQSRVAQFGLARPSLVPPKDFRDLRHLNRYRRGLVAQRPQKQMRIQKILDRNDVRIGGVPTSTVFFDKCMILLCLDFRLGTTLRPQRSGGARRRARLAHKVPASTSDPSPGTRSPHPGSTSTEARSAFGSSGVSEC